MIHVPDLPDTRVPLVAEGSIGSGGLQVRLMTAAKVLYRRFMEEAPAT